MSNFYGPLFKFSRWILSLFYKKYSVDKVANFKGPVVYVSHHQNMHGPIVTLLSFPKPLHVWALHVFFNKHICFKQYSEFTFTKRFGWPKTLAKIMAFPISRFIPKLIQSGQAIPVYRGSRSIMDTFKKTIEVLNAGEHVIIFPNIDYSSSSATVGYLYDGFLFIEKYFFKETGRHICFVPLYASKKKKALVTGTPIYFRDGHKFQEERKFVLEKIKTELNALAIQSGDDQGKEEKVG